MNAYGRVWTSSYRVVICVCQDLNKRSQIQKVPRAEESFKNISLMCVSSFRLFHSLWKSEASVLKVVFNQAVEKRITGVRTNLTCVWFFFFFFKAFYKLVCFPTKKKNNIKRSRKRSRNLSSLFFIIKEDLIINCHYIHLNGPAYLHLKSFSQPLLLSWPVTRRLWWQTCQTDMSDRDVRNVRKACVWAEGVFRIYSQL